MDEEKKYLINVEDNLDEYAKNVEDARKRVEDLTIENYKLKHSTTASREEVEKKAAALRVAKQDLRNAQKNLDYMTRSVNANEHSYEELYRQWQVAQTELKLLSNTFEMNADGTYRLSEAYVEASKKVKNLKEGLDKFGKGVNDNRLNVGNYTKSIQDAISGLDFIPGAAGGAAKGMRLLNTAMSANPILLLIPAFTKLISIFKSTDAGGTKLASTLDQIKAIFDVLRQRILHFSKAIGHLFKGEWRKAGEEMRNSFSGIAEQMKEATAAAKNYQYQLDILLDSEQNYISEAAEIRRAVAKLEYSARDRTKSVEERKKALQEAIRLEEVLLADQKRRAKARLDLEIETLARITGLTSQEIYQFIRMTDAQQQNVSDRMKFVRNTHEKELFELEAHYAKWIDIDTNFFIKQRRNISRLSGFMLEEVKLMKDEQKKILEEYFDPFHEAVNEELKRLTTIEGIRLKELQVNEDFYRKQEELIKERVRLAKWETDQIILNQQLKEQAAISSLSSISSIFGQQTQMGKAFAVSAATMDTYAAANKALNDPAIPSTAARIGMMASVILKGLANVKQIMSVKMGGAIPRDRGAGPLTASPATKRFQAPVMAGTAVGVQAQTVETKQLTADDIVAALSKMPAPVVSVEEIQAKTANKTKIEVKARI